MGGVWDFEDEPLSGDDWESDEYVGFDKDWFGDEPTDQELFGGAGELYTGDTIEVHHGTMIDFDPETLGEGVVSTSWTGADLPEDYAFVTDDEEHAFQMGNRQYDDFDWDDGEVPSVHVHHYEMDEGDYIAGNELAVELLPDGVDPFEPEALVTSADLDYTGTTDRDIEGWFDSDGDGVESDGEERDWWDNVRTWWGDWRNSWRAGG